MFEVMFNLTLVGYQQCVRREAGAGTGGYAALPVNACVIVLVLYYLSRFNPGYIRCVPTHCPTSIYHGLVLPYCCACAHPLPHQHISWAGSAVLLRMGTPAYLPVLPVIYLYIYKACHLCVLILSGGTTPTAIKTCTMPTWSWTRSSNPSPTTCSTPCLKDKRQSQSQSPIENPTPLRDNFRKGSFFPTISSSH